MKPVKLRQNASKPMSSNQRKKLLIQVPDLAGCVWPLGNLWAPWLCWQSMTYGCAWEAHSLWARWATRGRVIFTQPHFTSMTLPTGCDYGGSLPAASGCKATTDGKDLLFLGILLLSILFILGVVKPEVCRNCCLVHLGRDNWSLWRVTDRVRALWHWW